MTSSRVLTLSPSYNQSHGERAADSSGRAVITTSPWRGQNNVVKTRQVVKLDVQVQTPILLTHDPKRDTITGFHVGSRDRRLWGNLHGNLDFHLRRSPSQRGLTSARSGSCIEGYSIPMSLDFLTEVYLTLTTRSALLLITCHHNADPRTSFASRIWPPG